MKTKTCGLSTAAGALAAALGLALIASHRSSAAPLQPYSDTDSPQLKLLSPAPLTDFRGARPIEIDALYEGTPGNEIVSLDLYIDGTKAQTLALNGPERKGIASFLIDASLLSPGNHYVVVRATAQDEEVRSVRGEFVYGSSNASVLQQVNNDQNSLAWPSSPGMAPELRLMYPAPESKVQGQVTIKVDANDVNSSTPYVSIFVDGQMKQLVNYRPFDYVWDTTTLSNGWHTIAVVEAFDDASLQSAQVKPIRVYVDNPGGNTFIRTDLLDGAKPFRPAISAPLTASIPAGKKSARQSVAARRLRGSALLAPSMAQAVKTEDNLALMAEANPALEEMNSVLLPALSAPEIASIAPHPDAAPARAVAPPRIFKPVAKSRLLGAPAVASAEVAAQQEADLQLMAEAPMLEETLSAPLLDMPTLPASAAMPMHVLESLARPVLHPETVKPLVEQPSMKPLTMKIHVPAAPAHLTNRVGVHVGSGNLAEIAGQMKVDFNSVNVMLDRPLVVKENVLFGPLRQLFEEGGGTLDWNSKSGVVRAQTAKRDVQMTIGQTEATINQKAFKLESAPYISNGRTMVPVTFLSAALDASVQFDPATGHLKITSLH